MGGNTNFKEVSRQKSRHNKPKVALPKLFMFLSDRFFLTVAVPFLFIFCFYHMRKEQDSSVISIFID